MGVPVGVQANLALALAEGGYDVVHGVEPGLPSLSYLALRDTRALSVATFFSPDRLTYPPSRGRRVRLQIRIDAFLAASEEVAAAASLRLPGDYRVVSPGVDTELFRPAEKRNLIVVEWRPGERALSRSVLRALRELDGWEVILLRTKPLVGRPSIPLSLRGPGARPHRPLRRGSRTAPERGCDLRPCPERAPASLARGGGGRRGGRAASRRRPAAGARRRGGRPSGRERRRPRAKSPRRSERAQRNRASAPSRRTSTVSTRGSPAAAGASAPIPTRSLGASWILCDLHLHTSGRTTARSTSPTCSTTRRRSASARSPSPTTTCSAGRRRPSGWPRAGR